MPHSYPFEDWAHAFNAPVSKWGAVFIHDAWARAEGATGFQALTHGRQVALRTRLASTLGANTHDAAR